MCNAWKSRCKTRKLAGYLLSFSAVISHVDRWWCHCVRTCVWKLQAEFIFCQKWGHIELKDFSLQPEKDENQWLNISRLKQIKGSYKFFLSQKSPRHKQQHSHLQQPYTEKRFFVVSVETHISTLVWIVQYSLMQRSKANCMQMFLDK